jgi:hypothetical protein
LTQRLGREHFTAHVAANLAARYLALEVFNRHLVQPALALGREIEKVPLGVSVLSTVFFRDICWGRLLQKRIRSTLSKHEPKLRVSDS